MPTRHRRRFVSQAIWYFLRQDFAARELIVVDDGENSLADLIPADPRIRYVRTSSSSVAAKRNLGCSLAGGEYIAHWDDETWYSPQRLAAQVHELQSSGAEVAALDQLLHYQPLTGRVWQREADGPGRKAPHPGTLLYRRAYWHENRFSDGTRDGTPEFLRRVPPNRLAIQDGSCLAVAVLVGSGTSGVNPSDPCWQPRPFAELSRTLALDLEFYARLRGGQAPGGQEHALAPITLAATFIVYDGYGSMAEYLALGLARAGADVHIAPFRIDPVGVSPELQALWQHSRPDPDGLVLCHAWWGENLARFGSARDLFVKTVWETSSLPRDWPARLNHARAVIVPSDFAARVFRESGVRAPVQVVYEGLDPEVYPYVERPERPGLTTLIVGVLAPRKNYRQAVAAWQLAFAGDPGARLILKARFQADRFVPDDPRIQVVDSNEPTRGILHWYRQADVLLALGNEGFGLPLVEAMATGLPAVALDSEAQADVLAAGGKEGPLALPVRVVAWEKVDSPAFGPAGVRALPDVQDAARQLRWVAEHRAEAREIGRRASTWAHTQRNVWSMGPATLDVIERYARTPRPVRRTYAIWAPGGDGVAAGHFAREIARHLPLARVYEAPPVAGSLTAWRSPVLHIQHAPGLADDAELTRQVQAAQQAGMSTVVTEHRVGDRALAWEQAADALIALDPAAAARLRARWPHKRVELIPPGCPAWHPAQRPPGGKTIALLGQPGPELGGVRAALAALRGARLLLFLPPGQRPTHRRQGRSSAGPMSRPIPLRSAGLPDEIAMAEDMAAEKLARRLRAAADVVILWDRERDGGNSYLLSVALATGLPVLAAPAGDAPAPPPYPAGPVFRPEDLAAAVHEVLNSPRRRAELAAAARAYCAEWSWQRVAGLHLALWRTLAP